MFEFQYEIICLLLCFFSDLYFLPKNSGENIWSASGFFIAGIPFVKNPGLSFLHFRLRWCSLTWKTVNTYKEFLWEKFKLRNRYDWMVRTEVKISMKISHMILSWNEKEIAPLVKWSLRLPYTFLSVGSPFIVFTNGIPAMKNPDALRIFSPEFFGGKYKSLKWSCLPSLLYCISRKTVDTEYTYYSWCMTSTDIVKWKKNEWIWKFWKRNDLTPVFVTLFTLSTYVTVVSNCFKDTYLIAHVRISVGTSIFSKK
jgi:hypothetical protein